MGEPWGLSGSQFLGVYVAGLLLVLAISRLLRQLLRGLPGYRPTRDLDPYEVAYLGGGPERTAEVIVAEQIERGAVRVDSRGRLFSADQTAWTARTGPAAAMNLIAADGLRASTVCYRLKSDPAVDSIRDWLQAEGLLVPAPRMAFLRLVTAVLYAALLVTGIARLAEGISNHRPVADLVLLLIATVLIGGYRLARTLQVPVITRRGSSYLKRLRQLHGSGRLPASLALSGPAALGYGALAASALFAVALDGFRAVPDEAMRNALLAGMPSAASGSTSGGCGGGGCGGGGCGGGGCGG